MADDAYGGVCQDDESELEERLRELELLPMPPDSRVRLREDLRERLANGNSESPPRPG